MVFTEPEKDIPHIFNPTFARKTPRANVVINMFELRTLRSHRRTWSFTSVLKYTI